MAFGAFQALMSLLAAIIGRSASEMRGREIWIKFATWILLALEFALAKDIAEFERARQSGENQPSNQPVP